MDTSAQIALLHREGSALLAAATDPIAPVAACPGWTVADLVWHIAEVHHFWAAVVEERLRDRSGYEPPERPPEADLPAFARRQLERLVEALTAANPATPVWTWASQKDVAFVQRRMAQETMVHRWDAERALGVEPAPFDRDAAVDGIDEFFDHFAPDRAEGSADLAGTVHLHATDGAGEWHLAQDGDHLVVRREHAKGDVAARASASDLLLLLWARRSPDEVEVLGARSVLDALIAWTDRD